MHSSIKLFKALFFLIVFFFAFSTAEAQENEPDIIGKEKVKASSPDSTDEKNQKDSPDQAAEDKYVRPDGKTRFNRYVKSIFGPTALARTVAGAGVSTWRNSPDEWGDKWEGFGRRAASSFGKNVIKQTAIYSLDEAFKLDSRFYRSRKKDFGSRLKNALISPVTARNAKGKRVFGFPRVVGTYTANVTAAEAWFPDRYNYKDGLRKGTISLGMNAAFNVVKEFVLKKK